MVEDNHVKVDFEVKHVALKLSDWLADVLKRCNGVLEHQPIWTRDELSRVSSRKLPNCIYVHGNKSGNMVNFMSATILRGFLPSAFFRGLENGFVLIDFDARTKGDRGIRNHGTKFRVRPHEFGSLYEEKLPVQ